MRPSIRARGSRQRQHAHRNPRRLHICMCSCPDGTKWTTRFVVSNDSPQQCSETFFQMVLANARDFCILNSVACEQPFLGSSMVEHAAVNRAVVGSSPTRGAIVYKDPVSPPGRVFSYASLRSCKLTSFVPNLVCPRYLRTQMRTTLPQREPRAKNLCILKIRCSTIPRFFPKSSFTLPLWRSKHLTAMR